MTVPGTVVLGEVANFVRGINFKPDDVVSVGTVGTVACLRTKNVQTNLDLSDVWAVGEQFVRRDEQYLRDGDLLVSSANSWNLVGKCCWVPALPWRATFGGFVSALRPNPERIFPRFLYHWFSSSRVQTTVRSFGQQTTNISNLNAERCLQMMVPLPSLTEQRRIAEVLDRVETLRAKRRASLAQLDTLVQSLFFELFGEKLDAPAVDIKAERAMVPKGCSWRLLTEVARLATGHTPDRERDDYWDGDIPWVSLTDIRDLDGKIAERTGRSVTALGIENSSAVLLPAGTVCFSRTASVGFVTVMGRKMATSQDFMNWVCGPDIEPVYLMWALITSRARLSALSSGSTHRTIYMRVVEQFHLLLPPIEKQREFARHVVLIDKLKAAQRASLIELDALFSSQQHRAFCGEL